MAAARGSKKGARGKKTAARAKRPRRTPRPTPNPLSVGGAQLGAAFLAGLGGHIVADMANRYVSMRSPKVQRLPLVFFCQAHTDCRESLRLPGERGHLCAQKAERDFAAGHPLPAAEQIFEAYCTIDNRVERYQQLTVSAQLRKHAQVAQGGSLWHLPHELVFGVERGGRCAEVTVLYVVPGFPNRHGRFFAIGRTTILQQTAVGANMQHFGSTNFELNNQTTSLPDEFSIVVRGPFPVGEIMLHGTTVLELPVTHNRLYEPRPTDPPASSRK